LDWPAGPVARKPTVWNVEFGNDWSPRPGNQRPAEVREGNLV
jgi:hypothetical protein